jgi:hypothetical protein
LRSEDEPKNQASYNAKGNHDQGAKPNPLPVEIH